MTSLGLPKFLLRSRLQNPISDAVNLPPCSPLLSVGVGPAAAIYFVHNLLHSHVDVPQRGKDDVGTACGSVATLQSAALPFSTPREPTTRTQDCVLKSSCSPHH